MTLVTWPAVTLLYWVVVGMTVLSFAAAGRWGLCSVVVGGATLLARLARKSSAARNRSGGHKSVDNFRFLADGLTPESAEGLSDLKITVPAAAPRRKRKPVAKLVNNTWPPYGGFQETVYGESKYQAAILRALGATPAGWTEKQVMAELVCEPGDAVTGDVGVYINGAKVGELPGGNAILFRRRLVRRGLTRQTTRCHAQIRGGGKPSHGNAAMLGVFLDIAPFN